jgi:predicted Zn-dependent protease
MTRTNADALESSQSRLANAVNLAVKGAYDKALDIIRELMTENPEHTFLYTNYLKIKAEKETREKEELIQGLQSLDELENAGELAMAVEKARQLLARFPHEETLPILHTAIRNRFVLQLEEKVRKAIAAGELQQAAALLESNIRLVPEETHLQELQDSIDMEKQKNEHIRQEMSKAHRAVKENRIDDALETVNSLIPLSPNNQELKDFLKDVIYRKTRSL